MNRQRLQELQIEAEAERLSYSEIAEIEAAFAEVPDHQLRDARENATADDMLEEIVDWLEFNAVLSKNAIAEELADYKKTGELNVDYILHQLRDIEAFTGEMNQPSVMDTYENA